MPTASLDATLLRPIVFSAPLRLVSPTSWAGHIPFAFWLVESLRPSVIVELGTHSGNSYSAFAQAVQQLGLPTACHAVDTWAGDPQAGFYSEDVFRDWTAFHDAHFSGFSRLMRMPFDEAAPRFADGSIDLLHLDGLHTEEAVRHDLETWLPKMSAQGVVLMHDINVRAGDFGVWRVWAELEQRYRTFAFLHGHGLGVLAAGTSPAADVQWLTNAGRDRDATATVRSFFASIGDGLASRWAVETQRLAAVAQQARADEAAQQLAEARGVVADREEQLRTLERAVTDAAQAMTGAKAEGDALRSKLEELEGAERLREQAESGEALRHQFEGAFTADHPEIARLRTELRAAGAALARARRESSEVPRAQVEIFRRALTESDQAFIEATRLNRQLEERAAADRQGAKLQTKPNRALTSPRAWLSAAGLTPKQALRSPGRVAASLAVLARPRLMRDLRVVVASGLFDPGWYLERNPDVARGRLSPTLHYVRHGRGEGRPPGPLFDTAFYLEHSPDVAALGVAPFEHYVRHGSSEGRRPNAWFDPAWYKRRYPDVAASGEEPLIHYARVGWMESRDPSPEFSTAGYLATHVDIAATGECPLAHYVRYGRHEGRLAPRADVGWATAAASERVMLDVRGEAGQHRTAPTLVCLSHALPSPPRAGNEIRVARLLERLRSRGYRVILVAAPLSGDVVDDARLDALARAAGNVVACDRNGHVRYRLPECNDVLADLHGTLTGNYSVRLAESLAKGPHAAEYLGIDRDFCHDTAIAVTLRLLEALRPETLLVEYVWMTRLLPLVDPGIVTVIDTIDVFSTKRDKVLTFGIDDWDVPGEEEARRLGRADIVVAIQETEAGLLRSLAPGRQVVTTGIDFPVVPVSPATAPIVLCVASDNPMNTAGIADFLRFAWPRVLAACPDARLRVVGAVGRSVPRGLAGVEIAGYVPDLADEYAGARVVINPAVAGTGLKIKSLEALAYLRPLVAWPNGVDGLPEAVLRLVPPAMDWFEFADQVAERLARTGPVFDDTAETAIRDFFSPNTVYGALEQAMQDARARIAGPPA